MGSSRLPGKSLLPIVGGMPLLELVLRRVAAAAELAAVVLVTSDTDADDPLAALAEQLGVAVFRGPLDDVLGRFAAALEQHPADAVVRVCADNPWVDPRAIDALVRGFAAAQPCDYASNNTPASGLPDGIGAEIVSAAALSRADAEATEPTDREHVTAYILDRPDEFRMVAVAPPPRRWPFLKLDVDTDADWRRARQLAERLPAADAPLWDVETVVRCATA